MAGKQSKSAMLVKKKVWVPMIAPALFNNQPIGEMYLTEDANPVGRHVTVSLMTLTGDPQRQNIHISFKISKAENNQLLTTLVGFKITPSAVRKMMRRARDRIDDSFVAKTQDGIAVRVKPVLITRGRSKGSVLADMRRTLRLTVVRALAKHTFVDFIGSLVAHKFQRELQDTLRKIYPLQVCELRDVHIETSENGLKNILSAPPAVEKPKEEAPVEQQEAQPEQPAQESETQEAA